MKPTRTCNWPPRLDVTLRLCTLCVRPPPRTPRRWRPVDPRLRGVALARWPGRPAKQRRFELCGVRNPHP